MAIPNGTIGLPQLSAKPSPPVSGAVIVYTRTDGVLYLQDSTGTEFVFGSVDFISSLTGDVTAVGPGAAAATVAYIGGQTATAVAYAASQVAAATNLNTPSTLVLRDSSGNFAANIITANLNGNANTATTATNFSGSLLGDVTGTQTATTVAKIQGVAVNPTTPIDAQFLIYNSTALQWVAKSLSGDILNTDLGVVTIQSNVVSNSKLTQMDAYTVKANATGLTANASDVNLGTVTESTSSVLVLSGWSYATLGSPTIQVLQAGSSQSGYLSSSDWTNFNSTYSHAITALTGDGTAIGPGSAAFTLATVNSNTGNFGNQTTVASFTVNAKGLITAASNVTIGNLTNSNLSGSAGITGANMASSTIANTNLAQMPANTVKANVTGIPANPIDTALGTLTEVTSSILTLTGWTDATIGSPTIQVSQATTSTSGYLSLTDWNTFNNKQPAGNYITALTNDVTATGPGSAAATVVAIQGYSVSNIAPTDAQLLIYNGVSNKWISESLSGDIALTNAGATTIQSNVVSNSKLAQMPANTVKANITGSTANASDVGLGTVTEAVSSILTLTGWTDATIGSPTIKVSQATTSTSGYLSSTDWNTFNNKQPAGNYITALTGDGTATGPGSAVFTLATVNSNIGTFGSSTAIPSFTVNAKGLITAVTTDVVVAPAGTLTGTTLASNVVNSSLTSVGTIVSGVWNAGAITTTSLTDTSLTAGSVVFIGASGLLTQDNANFFWNDSSVALGIGAIPQSTSTITTTNISGAAKPIWSFGYGVGSSTGLRGDFARGTVSLPTAAQSGDVLNFFSGRGYGTSQFAVSSTGSMSIYAGETFTNTSNATYLAFKTTPTGSVTSAERMRINSTGNILMDTITDNGTDTLQIGSGLISGYTKLAGSTSGYLQHTIPAIVTTYILTWPSAQGAAGTFLCNIDGAGTLGWSNPVTNIDGGSPSSVYTPAQYISGGTP